MKITEELLAKLSEYRAELEKDEKAFSSAKTAQAALDAAFPEFTQNQKAEVAMFLDQYMDGLTAFLMLCDLTGVPLDEYIDTLRDGMVGALTLILTSGETPVSE